MLVSLRLSNYVLMEDCRIEFHPGLNALTGETGAGKSILVDALNLLVGERSSSESVRDTDREAIIEAAFELGPDTPVLEELQRLLDESGFPFEANTILIRRTLSPEGRNRIFLNHSQCLLKQLREVGDLLLDLHGQHEHQSLLRKSTYRSLLDRWGDYDAVLAEYRRVYSAWSQIRREMEELERNVREQKRREETLRRQIEEIDAANLREGEMEAVENRLQVIRHAERLQECCSAIVSSLCEGERGTSPILDELNRLESLLAEMARLDPSLHSLPNTWQSAVIALNELSRDLQSYAQSLEYDPAEQEHLQQRRFLLRDLMSKYGATIAEVLDFRNRIEEERHHLLLSEEEREQIQKKEQELREQLIRWGTTLHEKRSDAAKRISHRVTIELNHLGMEQSRFEIQVDYRCSAEGLEIGQTQPVVFGPWGADEIELLVSTIPDRPPRPLREVASGGEISRIMLALKCTFGEADPVPTMIFDEIDIGVGGKTAETVAERMASLARKKQVICVTHLPHIASRADRNLKVEKLEKDGRLISAVTPLSGKEREKELARMLGGEDSTASQRYARELLKASKR